MVRPDPYVSRLSVWCGKKVNAGTVRSDSQADGTYGVLRRVGGSMPSGGDITDEQRAVWQFHRFAVAITVVHQETMIFAGSDPGLASAAVKDDAQAMIAGRIRAVETNQRAIAQNVETRRKHSHAERRGRSPRPAVVTRPANI